MFKTLIASIASVALMSSSFAPVVEGRKTYLVKESIERGDLKVHHPRVRADADCEWCVFQDDINSFCITADEDWTVGFFNEQYSIDEDDTDDDGNVVFAHFRHGQTYYTTQAASMTTSFYLEKLYTNEMTYSLDEFSFSFKWEVYYFYEFYAWCLNFSHLTDAILLSIISSSALITCTKTIIECFDDFDTWTSPDALIFDDCPLSSGTDVTVWSYEPLDDENERYWFGDGTYTPSMCWPGSTPLYSYFDMYPNNPGFAFW